MVGQAGKPKTITGFQTHTTPVLLAYGERAELATEECILYSSPNITVLSFFLCVCLSLTEHVVSDSRKLQHEKDLPFFVRNVLVNCLDIILLKAFE